MTRCRSIGLLGVVLGLLLAACAPEVHRISDDRGVERAPGDLIEQMNGRWKLHLEFSSDCPVEWQSSLPVGQTQWTDTGDQLVIESTEGLGSSLKLWLTGPQSLESVTTLYVEGCEGTETTSLVVDRISATYASGLYSSRITHNGTPCQTLVEGPTLPEQCETIIQWQGLRTAFGK